ncbi:hypothetical protein [Bacillus sp. CECT 9360]|uniref:hypothetical protein n=1 Tax=Bacillus sp. CECT 9360 TaxID=2845821 RepID=UPI001E40622A|nr:hypothetical protein [Bacillus sp. CECT 9360]CAH0346081.1 hypothetical protein BCI9360_02399 [Bacillus sp. CECT 9360]
MGNSSCRYVINAIGKSGQIYLNHFEDKHALNKWIADHEDKLIMNELKVIDRKKNPFLNWFFK